MRTLASVIAVLPLSAFAETPVVVADTPIIHSLTARIAEGSQIAPDLLLPGDFSAHHGSLRPSQARVLGSADLVIWTGADLTPWLAPALDTLSSEAAAVELLTTEGWTTLAGQVHHHEPGRGEAEHEDHAEREDHAAERDGAEIDPHAWLDPDVALVWAGLIAGELSRISPDASDVFAANLDAFGIEVGLLKSEIADILDPHASASFVVGHDAYGYFARAFDLAPKGAILPPGAHDVGPRHLAEIRELMVEGDITCILSDRETPAETAELVAAANDARIVVTDPEGRTAEPGPGLYAATMRSLAGDLARCLGAG